MLMDEGLDTGPMLATSSVQIDESTTTIKLHDQLATIGGPLLVDTLKKLDIVAPLHPNASQTKESPTPTKFQHKMHALTGAKTVKLSCDKFMRSIPRLAHIHLQVTNA